MILAIILIACGLALLGCAWWENQRAGLTPLLIGLALCAMGLMVWVVARFFAAIGIF